MVKIKQLAMLGLLVSCMSSLLSMLLSKGVIDVPLIPSSYSTNAGTIATSTIPSKYPWTDICLSSLAEILSTQFILEWCTVADSIRVPPRGFTFRIGVKTQSLVKYKYKGWWIIRYTLWLLSISSYKKLSNQFDPCMKRAYFYCN